MFRCWKRGRRVYMPSRSRSILTPSVATSDLLFSPLCFAISVWRYWSIRSLIAAGTLTLSQFGRAFWVILAVPPVEYVNGTEYIAFGEWRLRFPRLPD